LHLCLAYNNILISFATLAEYWKEIKKKEFAGYILFQPCAFYFLEKLNYPYGRSQGVTSPRYSVANMSRCGAKIPQFGMPSSLQEHLSDLLARGRKADCVIVIQNESGCDIPTAKIWAAHHGLDCFQNPPCPHCGKHSERGAPGNVGTVAMTGIDRAKEGSK
jgi:hypothetical protein